jgi:outer membrane immunogenic protein
MKCLLLATVAAVAFIVPEAGVRAADMAVKAPPVASIPPPFNWTGFYVGGNVGAGGVSGALGPTGGGPLGSDSVDGNVEFIGGGQIGYNWQFGPNIVFGVEWFFDGISGNDHGAATFISPADGDLVVAAVKADWVTTVTGRIGFTFPTADHWMFYFKGGGAWLQTQATISDLTVPASIGVSKTASGWVAGAGVEWAFAQNWTMRFSYKYIGLDNVSVNSGLLRDSLTVQNPNFQSATFGINYLFNWGGYTAGPPVVSRY